jgi:putative transposase
VCCFGHVGAGCDLPKHEASLPVHLPDQNGYAISTNNNQIMQLNALGTIAHHQWYWLQKQYPYVVLHSFIVMPNHVHGILEIDSDLLSDKTIKIKSLSELIGAYKTTSSKQIHLAGKTNFSWQRSFHDHIIRNAISYERISNYIDTNAERWNADTFFENS